MNPDDDQTPPTDDGIPTSYTEEEIAAIRQAYTDGDISDDDPDIPPGRLLATIDQLAQERDRLAMQIVDAFTYFKESTAETVCDGPKPTLVYQLVEQLWSAWQKDHTDALAECSKAALAVLDKTETLRYVASVLEPIDTVKVACGMLPARTDAATAIGRARIALDAALAPASPQPKV